MLEILSVLMIKADRQRIHNSSFQYTYRIQVWQSQPETNCNSAHLVQDEHEDKRLAHFTCPLSVLTALKIHWQTTYTP